MTKIPTYQAFNKPLIIACLSAIFVFLVFLMRPDTSKAQEEFTHYKFRVGFFTGPVSYIGDYNPWILGSAYNFSDDISLPGNSSAGEVDFGMWTKAMLKPYLYLRGNAHFGSLTYNWNSDNVDYQINSSYSSIGLLLETVAFPNSTLQPYLSSGIKRFNYEVPPPISQNHLNQYTVSEFGESKHALMIPVNIGINYQASHLSNFFLEASLSFSNTDDIDNLSVPASENDMLYQNDAIFSLRFGVGISLIDALNLKTPKREIQPAQSYSYPTDRFADVPPISSSMQTAPLVPQDSIEAAKSRLDTAKLAAKDQQQDQKNVIEVTDPENRDLEISEEIEKIQEMEQEMEEKSESGELEDKGKMRDRVPRIDVRDPDLEVTDEESNIVTIDPPEGYYIQVYASVGTESAQRARKMAINAIGHILENPQKQVIITKREQYYEVQIGAFDSYDDTIRVLEEAKETFSDAFTLMYVKR